MSFLALNQTIIQAELCTSCGLCEAVCPQSIISISEASVPLPYATLDEADILSACGSCRLCLDICPGLDTGVPETEQRVFRRTREERERWTGIYGSSYQLSSTNPIIATASAAGGACTSLAVAALEEGMVDAMLVVSRDPQKPWIPTAILADTVEMIIEAAQSSYCITPTLQLLKETPYEKIGIIGVPCQIQAVQKLKNEAEADPRLRALADKIAFTVEIACASSTSRDGTVHLITNMLGIPLEEVAEMRYRSGDYPGQFMVRTLDGNRHYFPFYRLVEEFKKFKTYRCLTCPDWWSGVSDISVSDGDPDIYTTSKRSEAPNPSSTVLVRTEVGKELLGLAERNGLIALRDYEFVTNLGLERKRHRYRHYARKNDRPIPAPPGADPYTEALLSDDEVINRGVQAPK